jgi:hypothetical protein
MSPVLVSDHSRTLSGKGGSKGIGRRGSRSSRPGVSSASLGIDSGTDHFGQLYQLPQHSNLDKVQDKQFAAIVCSEVPSRTPLESSSVCYDFLSC